MKKLSLVLLVASLSACVKLGEAVIAIKLHPDGKRVFMIVERNYLGGPDTIQKYAILITGLDSSRKRELFSGDLITGDLPERLKSSPDGKYVMFAEGDRLIIQDVRTKKLVIDRKYHVPFPMGLRWLPGSDRVSLTDSEGLKVLPLRDQEERLLIDKGLFSLVWSSDAKFIICADDRGWPGGGDLYLIDSGSMEKRHLYNIPSGNIIFAGLSSDDEDVYFVVNLIGGKGISAMSLNLQKGEVSDIWSDDHDAIIMHRIMLTADSKSLLIDTQTAIIVLDIISKQIKRIPFSHSRDPFGLMPLEFWDYNGMTNEIIMFDRSGSVLRRIGINPSNG